MVQGRDEEDALRAAPPSDGCCSRAPEGVRVLGPAVAPVARLKNEYRYQMLLKAVHPQAPHEVLAELRRFAAAEKWNPTSLVIDVDPMTLL